MSGLINQVRNWFAAGRRRAELSHMDASELNRIANEVGVSTSELDDLVTEGAEAAALLPRRLREEHLEAAAIAKSDPATLRDMQRVCSHCGHHARCEHELNNNPHDAAWQSYCPNAETMRALKAAS